MTILIVLFVVMTLISMIVILSATLVASRSDREFSEWRDLEEFERSLQEQPPRRATPPSTSDAEDRNSMSDSNLHTSPN